MKKEEKDESQGKRASSAAVLRPSRSPPYFHLSVLELLGLREGKKSADVFGCFFLFATKRLNNRVNNRDSLSSVGPTVIELFASCVSTRRNFAGKKTRLQARLNKPIFFFNH